MVNSGKPRHSLQSAAQADSDSPFPIPQSRLYLVYGGTFDPVHDGHMAIARAARDQLQAVVHLMPAADPPHRVAPGANAEQRVRMLELAIDDEAGLMVDRRELLRSGRSYTIDTLRELRAEIGPDQPLVLLIGADSFISLPTWREWEELLNYTHFVVAQRPGSPLDVDLPPELALVMQGRWATTPGMLQARPAGRVLLLEQPMQPESASEVRRRIAENQPWQALVPPAVAAFIVANRLYSQPATGLSPL